MRTIARLWKLVRSISDRETFRSVQLPLNFRLVVKNINLEEKKKTSKDFIRTRFTYGTYEVLFVFRENIVRMSNLVESHLILLERIDSGDIKHTFSEEQLVRLKHLIMVDTLSKIMIMIESVLSLFDCFSRFPYKEIPQKMVRYQLVRINGFVKRLQEGKVSFWKMAGFPCVKFLGYNCGLSSNEKQLLHKILHDSSKSIENTMKDIVDFYLANKILYGKFKHGLLFIPGFHFSYKKKRETPDSVFLAFDRLKGKPSKLCFEGRKIFPSGLEWFNTYSILPYWNNTFKAYRDILSIITRLSDHIIFNHLLWACNCGQDYLPTKKLPSHETVVEIYLTKELSEEENQRFREITQKVMKNTIFPTLRLRISFNFSDEKMEKILKSFLKNQSATIWKLTV